MMNSNLFPYQRIGAQWLADQPRAGMLADEMGLGKTIQAIAAADEIGAMNILVLCPGILRDTWQREFEQWATIPRTISVIRKMGVPKLAQVVISSYHAIQSRHVLTALLNQRWDVLICDEAHLLKNPESLTSIVVYGYDHSGVKGLASRADHVWLLTGTPMPNGPHEMWTHCRALFPDACRNLERYNAWLDRFCYWQQGDYGPRILNLNEKYVPEFIDRVAPHVKRRNQEDVLPDLPELRYGHVVVTPDKVPPMPEQAIEAAAIIQAALSRATKDPTPEQITALVNTQALHIASLLKWTGIAKAPAVADAIKTDMENGLQKVVVFAKHKEVFRILEEKIPGSVSITGDTPDKIRQYIVDGFQGRIEGYEPKCLNCQIDVASMGLTLTAASTVAVVETGWVPMQVQQAIKRLHRIGQRNPVLAKIYSLAGSLDEAVNEVIVRKYRTITKLEQELVS